jgi:hypothetical protein
VYQLLEAGAGGGRFYGGYATMYVGNKSSKRRTMEAFLVSFFNSLCKNTLKMRQFNILNTPKTMNFHPNMGKLSRKYYK